jgi:hypothetical protein
MSGLDPFGSSAPSLGYRSKNGGMSKRESGNGMFQQLSHIAKDVSTQIAGPGKSWIRTGSILGGTNIAYGFITIAFVLIAMRNHTALWHGVLLGAFLTESVDPSGVSCALIPVCVIVCINSLC